MKEEAGVITAANDEADVRGEEERKEKDRADERRRARQVLHFPRLRRCMTYDEDNPWTVKMA